MDMFDTLEQDQEQKLCTDAEVVMFWEELLFVCVCLLDTGPAPHHIVFDPVDHWERNQNQSQIDNVWMLS